MGHGPPSPQKQDCRSVLHNNDTNLEAPDSNSEPNSEPLAPEPMLASNAISNANLASPNHGCNKQADNKQKHINKCHPTVMAWQGMIIIRMNMSL